MNFPDHIDGWFTLHEGVLLAAHAYKKVVLEIGAFKGRSTVCMAQTATKVLSVDPFDGRATGRPIASTLEEYKENIVPFGDKVSYLVGTIDEVGPRLTQAFDLVFIDAAHDYESVTNDIRWALQLLRANGLIAFHDYRYDTPSESKDAGVEEAVNEFLKQGARHIAQADSLAIVSPP